MCLQDTGLRVAASIKAYLLEGYFMYKAIQTQTGEEIIILHPAWQKRIPDLREMDRADRLVCQGCLQPLRVKAGQFKRPHFAHKHLQACSYGSESPEILQARAVLFSWLYKQFGEAVTLEKEMPGSNLPRLVDCWVAGSSGTFVYWIIEAGIKLETREAILSAFAGNNLNIHWIFLHSMLNEEKKEFHSLLLTPTERAFLQATPYDEMLAGAGETGQSLHYLDVDTEKIITFRGLTLHHRPNWFKGIKKATGLAGLYVDPADGAIVHPGEMERLRKFRQRQQRHQQKQRLYQQREAEWARHIATHSFACPRAESKRANDQGIQSYRTGMEELPCALCGQITTDYWSTFFDENGRKLCRCRECLDQERNRS